jgi:colicin import membrane protein
MSLSLFLLAAAASAPLNQSATRAEVAAQRAAIEQRFAREKTECEQRFAVSPCLEDLRERRQAALAPLIRHEHELDAEDRHARAAAQVQRVKERDLAAAQDEGQRRQRLVTAPPPSPPTVPASHPVRARSPEEAAQERQRSIFKAEREAAQRRERAEERQARMRERLAAREAKEKARTKPLAAPLPLPGASAASK